MFSPSERSWSPGPSIIESSARSVGSFGIRYEDISQDGRIGLRTLSHGIGASVWRASLLNHPAYAALVREGIVPILARAVIVGGGGPIAVGSTVAAEGSFSVARAIDERGEARLRVDMHAEMRAPLGRSWGPAPEGAGQPVLLGRMYAEHVLTRPFGPPERRRVDALPEDSGLTAVTAQWTAPEHLSALPEGAEWLGEEEDDPSVTVFGLGHTDSNQHVNSMVYPLLLEEAALRWAARRGLSAPARFANFVELCYRKPFFAGEACQLTLRGYRRASGSQVSGETIIGVVARFTRPEKPGRPHGYAHLELVH